MEFVNAWLSFSRIQTPSSGARSHEIVTLRIYNADSFESLNITGLTISNPSRYTLPDGEDGALPIAIAPGAFRDIRVEFIESGGIKGHYLETLAIASTDPNTPVVPITLSGLYALSVGGANEPTVAQIRDTLGYTMDTGNPTNDSYTAQGEEILAPRWVRADMRKPIYIRQIAAYHGANSDSLRLIRALDNNPNGAISTIVSLTHDADDFNSLLPLINGESGPGEVLSTPTSEEFQVMIAGYRSGRTVDHGLSHGVRFWPVRNRVGAIVANTFMVAQDFVGNGFGGEVVDFNDNIYLITNIRPSTTPLAAGAYEETNGNLFYSGNWVDYSGPEPIGGSSRYTSVIGDSLGFAIDNSVGRIVVNYTDGATYGPFELCIDISCVSVADPTDPLLWGQSASVSVQTPGNHLVTLTNLSGQFMSIEAIELRPPSDAAALVTENEMHHGMQNEIASNPAIVDTSFVLADFVPGGIAFTMRMADSTIVTTSVDIRAGSGPAAIEYNEALVDGQPAPSEITEAVNRELPILIAAALDQWIGQKIGASDFTVEYVEVSAMSIALDLTVP